MDSLCGSRLPLQLGVAPAVLGIPIATVPSPTGLGYFLSRLRRSGFGAVDLGPARSSSQLMSDDSS